MESVAAEEEEEEERLTGRNGLDSLGVNGSSKDGSGGSSISSSLVSLAGDILDETIIRDEESEEEGEFPTERR